MKSVVVDAADVAAAGREQRAVGNQAASAGASVELAAAAGIVDGAEEPYSDDPQSES